MEENKNEELPSKKRGGSPEGQKERENSIKIAEPEGKIKNIKTNNKLKKEDISKVKKKKKVNKQIIIIIITIIVCVVLTILLIILKFKSLNEKYKYVEENNNVFESKDKIKDPDSIYILKNGDKIDYNDININEKYYYNGQEFDVIPDINYVDYGTFYKISGLKNKEVENAINNKLKQKVIEHGKSKARIMGNFSNILSILVSDYDNGTNYCETINIDLNTGNELKLEDLFSKSTPIYSIIYNSFLQMIAWDYDIDYYNYSSEEEYFAAREYALNMNNRDTSNYEDYLYKIIDEYNRNKDDLKFTISNTSICVYGFKNDGTYDKNDDNMLKILLYPYRDYVTAFKKYAGGDLYERQVTIKGLHPLYKNNGYFWDSELTRSEYQETDNMILDIYSYSHNDKSFDKTHVEKIKKDLQQYIDMANQDKSNFYVIQAFNWGYFSEEEYREWNKKYYTSYHSSNVTLSIVKIPIGKIEKLNERLAYASEMPRASVEPYLLSGFVKNDSDYTIIKDYERYDMYFDINGNYLGNNEDLVVDYSKTNNQFGQS